VSRPQSPDFSFQPEDEEPESTGSAARPASSQRTMVRCSARRRSAAQLAFFSCWRLESEDWSPRYWSLFFSSLEPGAWSLEPRSQLRRTDLLDVAFLRAEDLKRDVAGRLEVVDRDQV